MVETDTVSKRSRLSRNCALNRARGMEARQVVANAKNQPGCEGAEVAGAQAGSPAYDRIFQLPSGVLHQLSNSLPAGGVAIGMVS